MAEIPEEQKYDDLENKIQIFSNTDEKLKFLGKMLNSDSSREILQLLIDNQLTANELAEKTNLSLSLVIHHLNKMMQSEIVTVSKIVLNSKNQPMKYYTAKAGILILPEKISQKAKESKSFTKSLKSIMKFSVIGISGIVSWFTVKSIQEYSFNEEPTHSGIERFDLPTQDFLIPILIALIVINVGFLVQFSLNQYKRKVI
ncbi:MAG: ArsR family transcriptional regulator [Candidatus Nitrosotenuis sp.]